MSLAGNNTSVPGARSSAHGAGNLLCISQPDLLVCYMWSGHWGETKNRSAFTGEGVGAGVPSVLASLGACHVPGLLPALDVGTQGFPHCGVPPALIGLVVASCWGGDVSQPPGWWWGFGRWQRRPSVPAKGFFCFNPSNWCGTMMLPNGPFQGQLYLYYGIFLDVFGLRFSALLTSLN